jgi:hypothetical protein
MVRSTLRTAVACGFLLGMSAAVQAQSSPPPGNGFAPPPVQPVWQPPYPQYGPPAMPPAAPMNRPLVQNPAPAYVYPPPVNVASPVNQTPIYAAPPGYSQPQQPRPAENVPAPQPVNGSFHEEGDFIVIDVNGQQLRLPKAALAQQQSPNSAAVHMPTGTVHGRLLQNGQPVVNCTVVIVPMHKDGATDDGGVRQPLSTVTDAYGIFGFLNAPAGSYKLTWLPAGTNQWIRRIEMKPDVFVHEGQDTALKDVRMALRTIN